MSRQVRLTKAAERDLEQAAGWYHQEAPHVSPRFRLALREAQVRIGETPLAYPVIRRDLRRAVVHEFPYSIYFRLQKETILVVAITHHARHPRSWQRRR